MLAERDTKDENKNKSPKAIQRRKSDVSSTTKSSARLISLLTYFNAFIYVTSISAFWFPRF
jgi:hypothetical protein